jgi:hypothetical protein
VTKTESYPIRTPNTRPDPGLRSPDSVFAGGIRFRNICFYWSLCLHRDPDAGFDVAVLG